MGRVMAALYDRLTSASEVACLQQWRAELLAGLRGDVLEPLWKRLAGGCHLTRRTADAIVAAGFAIPTIKRESMRKAWPLVRPTIRGVAVKG